VSENFNVITIVAVQTREGSEPHIAIMISGYGVDYIVREPIRTGHRSEPNSGELTMDKSGMYNKKDGKGNMRYATAPIPARQISLAHIPNLRMDT
jgi:hypothetical protein